MSGWRTWGSSLGRASNTISLGEPVTRMHGLGQLEHRQFGSGLPIFTGRCSPDSASSTSPRISVVHVAEGARLRAVAEHRQRLARERLLEKRDRRTPVVAPHARAVRVEDAGDPRVHALLGVVGHRQRLRIALGLVVHAARADRVHVAPVALRLRMHLRVAVDLARRADQEAGALPLREPECVVRPVGADLERVQRQPQVVDRAGEGREVVDVVDRAGDLDVLDEVVIDELEFRGARDVRDVLEEFRSRDCRRRSPGAPSRAARRRGASRGSRRRRSPQRSSSPS